MSTPDPPDPPGEDPNATIQLGAFDAGDMVEYDEPDAPTSGEAPSRASHGPTSPPPLPVLAPPSPPVTKTGDVKTLKYVAIFLALVGGAVAVGLGVGSYARSQQVVAPAASTVSASVPPSVSASPAPSASEAHTLVIPTVEMTSP